MDRRFERPEVDEAETAIEPDPFFRSLVRAATKSVPGQKNWIKAHWRSSSFGLGLVGKLSEGRPRLVGVPHACVCQITIIDLVRASCEGLRSPSGLAQLRLICMPARSHRTRTPLPLQAAIDPRRGGQSSLSCLRADDGTHRRAHARPGPLAPLRQPPCPGWRPR